MLHVVKSRLFPKSSSSEGMDIHAAVREVPMAQSALKSRPLPQSSNNSGDCKRASVLQSALQSHLYQKIIYVSGSVHIE